MTDRNDPNPQPWWKKPLTIGSVFGIIISTAAFMETFRVKVKEDELNIANQTIKNLREQKNELGDDLADFRKKIEDKNQNGKSNKDQEVILFSGYEVSYTLPNDTEGDIAVELHLSEETKNKIASNPTKAIKAVVVFEPDQESFELWVKDSKRSKNKPVIITRDMGKTIDDARENELSFEIPIDTLYPKIDNRLVNNITFESKNISGRSKGFIVKSVKLDVKP